MFSDKNLDHYVINETSSIRETLDKITKWKSRVVMVVDKTNRLHGIVTNGDILRWLVKQQKPDLSGSIFQVLNRNYLFITEESPKEEIQVKLEKVNFLPLINNQNQLLSVVSNLPSNEIKFGHSTISPDHPCFVIAEIGINHGGSLKRAMELFQKAADCGVNAVKIQVRNLEATYNTDILKDSLKAEHGTQYLLEELRKVELSHKDFTSLKKLAEDLNLEFIATPFDLPSVDFLESLNVSAFKVGSPDFTNLPLLQKIASIGKPMIISTGMSNEVEIKRVLTELDNWNANYALLHCNSTYPASFEDLNLNFIHKLIESSGKIVGYSGHERGYLPSLAAVAMGVKIIERHLTLDNSAEGPDHTSSLEPSAFSKMIKEIRQIELCLGSEKRIINQGEEVNRVALGKSLVLTGDLEKGSKITADDLVAKTPARGVSPLEINKFIGKSLARDLQQGDYIHFEDISDNGSRIEQFNISKHWGVVGRLNDFQEFLTWRPKLIEIHLTWRDLVNFNTSAQNLKDREFDQDLVVHAPEYFQDKLIDFTTSETHVLDYSLEMLKLTIELAKCLGSKFKGMQNPKGTKIVVHPGGHFESRKETNRQDQYRQLLKNLREVDHSGVEILIENMPPNPWYFGGQWFNSIFLDSVEINQFCNESGFGICYDTSHALLHCNHSGTKLNQFTKNISEHVRHLHISDASGTTQEGLQIGKGCLDYDHLFEIFHTIDAGFIPEIWQGHLNNGKGFQDALKIIEGLLEGKFSTEGCSSKTQKTVLH